jgi:hypothetical protein
MTYTPAQVDAMQRRQAAAEALERARQIVRENARYGVPVTNQHYDAVRAAERDYDQASNNWPVIQRSAA